MSANYQIFLGCLIMAICAIGGYFGGALVKNGLEKKNHANLSQNISQSVEQTTIGDKSPNINAPNANSIHVTYGISEEVFKQWLNELKGESGKNKIIDNLLDDLKNKDVTIEVMQTQIEDGIAMRKELERRIAENPPEQSSDKLAPLTKLGHQDFIENFIAFRAYYQYRKTLQLLNPEMLIELLNIYFRSVLLFPYSEVKQYYITASDGRLLRLQLEGHNDKGEKILISIPELSASLLHDVCTDFATSANKIHYEKLLVLFKRALSTPELDKIQKANILDAQNFVMKNQLSQD